MGTRFGLLLQDVTEHFSPANESRQDSNVASQSPNDNLHEPTVQLLRIPFLSNILSRKQFDNLVKEWAELTTGIFLNEKNHSEDKLLNNLARQASSPAGSNFLRNLHFVRVKETKDGTANGICEWQSPLSKHVHQDARCAVNAVAGAVGGDMLVLATGCGWEPHAALGRIRLAAKQLLCSEGISGFSPIVDMDAAEAGHPQPQVKPSARSELLWIVEFPMFEQNDMEVGCDHLTYSSAHHPFAAPMDEDMDQFIRAITNVGTPCDSGEILSVRAQHHDLVLNGCEIAGGSMRIHDANLQRMVFDKVLQLSPERQSTFSHLLAALSQGAPPHGGIAFGLDRILSMLLGTDSIRDVIAFPKSATGRDLMTGAPAPVTLEQLREYNQILK